MSAALVGDIAQPNELDRLGQFDALIQLSRAMLSKARAGEWDDVFGMESQRQRLIRDAFAQPPAVERAAGIAAGIREILALDKELIALGRQRMAELSVGLIGWRKGCKATAAYAQNMR